MNVLHYPEEDAMLIYLRETEFSRGMPLDESRHLLLDAQGKVKTVSLLNISQGVDLDGIPTEDLEDVRAALAEYGISARG